VDDVGTGNVTDWEEGPGPTEVATGAVAVGEVVDGGIVGGAVLTSGAVAGGTSNTGVVLAAEGGNSAREICTDGGDEGVTLAGS